MKPEIKEAANDAYLQKYLTLLTEAPDEEARAAIVDRIWNDGFSDGWDACQKQVEEEEE